MRDVLSVKLVTLSLKPTAAPVHEGWSFPEQIPKKPRMELNDRLNGCREDLDDFSKTLRTLRDDTLQLTDDDPVVALLDASLEKLKIEIESAAVKSAKHPADPAIVIKTELSAMRFLMRWYIPCVAMGEVFTEHVNTNVLLPELNSLRTLALKFYPCTPAVKQILDTFQVKCREIGAICGLHKMSQNNQENNQENNLQTVDFYDWYVGVMLSARVQTLSKSDVAHQFVDEDQWESLRGSIKVCLKAVKTTRKTLLPNGGRPTHYCFPWTTHSQATTVQQQLLLKLSKKKDDHHKSPREGLIWDARMQAIFLHKKQAEQSLWLCFQFADSDVPAAVRTRLLQCMNDVTCTMSDWLFDSGKDEAGVQSLELIRANPGKRWGSQHNTVSLLMWEKWSKHESIVGQSGLLNKIAKVVKDDVVPDNLVADAVVSLLRAIVCTWLNWFPYGRQIAATRRGAVPKPNLAAMQLGAVPNPNLAAMQLVAVLREESSSGTGQQRKISVRNDSDDKKRTVHLLGATLLKEVETKTVRARVKTV